MSKPTATPMPTPVSRGRRTADTADLGNAAKQNFVRAALTMSWQLAVAVLLPIIGGVELGKAVHSKNLFTYIGLAIAVILSTIVMWNAMRVANRQPVPKLTAAQKKAIKKSYEEEDDD